MILNERVSFNHNKLCHYYTLGFDPMTDEPPNIGKYMKIVKDRHGNASLGSHNYTGSKKDGRNRIRIYYSENKI